MSATRRLHFAQLSAALLFLKRTLPRSPAERANRLAQTTVIRTSAFGPVILEVPADALMAVGAAQSLSTCGGQELLVGVRAPAGDALPITELFRITELVPTGRTEQARCFLVMPREGSDAAGALIGALAALPLWQVALHSWVAEAADGSFYELRSESGQPGPLPTGLPGAPLILAGIADDLFVPPGLTHPLIPDYRFLFPPQEPAQRHLWIPVTGRLPIHAALIEGAHPPEPLARRVVIGGIQSRANAVVPTTARVEVPLELQRLRKESNRPHSTHVLYRIDSRSSEFGPLLLRFLDHADAGIERFTYYSRALGEGPNSQIEHYLLGEARIPDEKMWPELTRFHCPQVLEDFGLPIYLPANRQLAPDIEGLLRGASAEDPILETLASLTGLSTHSVTADSTDPRIAVILPESAAQDWSVLHLEQGRPLAVALSVISQSHNREPIRRVLGHAESVLTEERKNHEERWIASGQAEGVEIANAIGEHASALTTAAASIDQDLTRLATRLDEAREVAAQAAEMVSTSLPGQLEQYSVMVCRTLSDLAQPQLQWLGKTEQLAVQLARAQESALTLQRDATQEVTAITTTTDERNRGLSEGESTLANRVTESTVAAARLTTAVTQAEASATSAEQALNAQATRLQTQSAALTARETNLNRIATEQEARQQAIRTQEAALNARQQQLEAQRLNLDRRAAAIESGQQTATAEEQRLRRRENVEIPSLQKQLNDLRAAIDHLRKTRIDERHAELTTALAEAESLKQRLLQTQRELQQLESRIAQLRTENEALRKSNEELGKQVSSATLSQVEEESRALKSAQAGMRSKAGSRIDGADSAPDLPSSAAKSGQSQSASPARKRSWWKSLFG